MKEACIPIPCLIPVDSRPLQPHSILFFIPTIQFHPCFLLGVPSSLSSHSRCFCNSAILFPTCPNSILFQASNFTQHFSKHDTKGNSDWSTNPSFHASNTTSSHLGFLSHIDSKQNIFFGLLLCFYTNLSSKGE